MSERTIRRTIRTIKPRLEVELIDPPWIGGNDDPLKTHYVRVCDSLREAILNGIAQNMPSGTVGIRLVGFEIESGEDGDDGNPA